MVANSGSCIVQYNYVQLYSPTQPGTQITHAHSYILAHKNTKMHTKGQDFFPYCCPVLIDPPILKSRKVSSSKEGILQFDRPFESTKFPNGVTKPKKNEKSKHKQKKSMDKQK